MNYTKKLLSFIKASPTAHHTVAEVKKRLSANGFSELSEKQNAEYRTGESAFVTRGDSSVIAFKGGKSAESFMIAASHTDFPAFKLTSISEKNGAYATLPTEKYGGTILYSWLDRPLSLAGRAVLKNESVLSVRLVNIDRDLLVIPSVAIHQNRSVNDGCKFNPAVDMLPLFSAVTDGTALKKLIAESLSVKADDIISSELYVYNREEGRVFGLNNEFVVSPRLDNLASVYTSLEAFLSAPEREDTVTVFCAFDNEEVGSSTKQGADSTFLSSVLTKIAGDENKLLSMLTDSFMVSLDNAHAKHPCHPELSNPEAAPLLGGGVAVKYNANQLYTTDAVSDGVIRHIAQRAGEKLQSFSTRADMPSGSTLGSIATTRLSLMSCDIGIPQLAMHSSSETCAASDIKSVVALLKEFYSTKIARNGDNIFFN